MAISREEVKKIASLARLNLTAEEETRHAETISAVLDYMEILNQLKTKNVEPTFQVTGLKNIYREDKAIRSDNQKELLAEMPKTKKEQLVVPGVFE